LFEKTGATKPDSEKSPPRRIEECHPPRRDRGSKSEVERLSNLLSPRKLFWRENKASVPAKKRRKKETRSSGGGGNGRGARVRGGYLSVESRKDLEQSLKRRFIKAPRREARLCYKSCGGVFLLKEVKKLARRPMIERESF